MGTGLEPALPNGADGHACGTAQMTGERDCVGEGQPELHTCTAALNAHTRDSNTRSASPRHPKLEHKQEQSRS